MDSLIGLYRIRIRSKKWYHRIFFHMLDLTVVNAWLLYKQLSAMKSPPVKPIRLHDFKSQVAQGLCKESKDVRKNDGTRKRRGSPDSGEQASDKKSRPSPNPSSDVRYDAVGHWPKWCSSRQRCKLSTCKGISRRVACVKCGVHLCFSNKHDCFRSYHCK